MNNEDLTKTGEGETETITENVPIVGTSNSRSRQALWLATPFIFIVFFFVAFGIYLLSSGIDISYAVGTSGWVAPPGSKLAGHDIGGKSFNEVESLLENMNSEFSGLSVWIVESSLLPSVYAGDLNFTSSPDHFALSIAPDEFGLSMDLVSIEKELDSLDQTSNGILLFKDRLDLWNKPPEIDAKFSLDRDAAVKFLEGIKSTVDCEPVNASMDLANHRISPALDGVSVDIESTLAGIPSVFPSLIDIAVELKTTHTAPEVTEEDFKDIDAENPLSSYTTNFSKWKRNRSFNIELGASLFEGVVIHPGEVFSFNAVTGPRGYEEGYLAAPMYLNSRPELEPAGGMCQVSTTLYNTLLLAGFDIVARVPHSRPCSYVPYGRDATVAYGSVDLKMRSTLAHPVIIHQVVDRHNAGTITFELFGHPDDHVNVEIGNAYSFIGRSDSMTKYVIDTSLEPCEEVVEDAGVNGISQRTWRIWYDEAGNEIRREDLTSDHVRPVGAFIRHNPCDGAPPPSSESPSEPPTETPPSDNPGTVF